MCIFEAKTASAYLNQRYSHSDGGAVMLPDEALDICRDYDRVTKQLNDLKEQKDALANTLKSYLKENETGTVGDRTVSWKNVTITFDKKRLALENREIYDTYTSQSSYRRFSVA